MMNDSVSSRTRCGATLVDVVAAGVAIVMLLVWLLPATASVSTNSKAARCLSHLARIGYANAIYAAEDPSDPALPVHPKFDDCPGTPPDINCTAPTYVGAYEWGGKSGVGRDEFVTGASGEPLHSKYGTFAGFGPPTRPLNRVLFPDDFPDHRYPPDRLGALEDTRLDLDAVQCPSDIGYTGIHCPDFEQRGLTSYDHFGTSYNANVFMTGSGGNVSSNSPYLHRMGDIARPERTLAFQENNGRFAWMAAPERQWCQFYLTGARGIVRGWHGKDWTFNAAFVDGHVDTIYMRGYGGEQVYEKDDATAQAYSCIIIRGEGWQVDTLPLERVRTRFMQVEEGRPSGEDCIEHE